MLRPRHPGVRFSKGRARFQPCHKKEKRITNSHSPFPEPYTNAAGRLLPPSRRSTADFLDCHSEGRLCPRNLLYSSASPLLAGVRLSKGRARFQPCRAPTQKKKTCHSERSRPTLFFCVRSRERVGLRSRGISLRLLPLVRWPAARSQERRRF